MDKIKKFIPLIAIVFVLVNILSVIGVIFAVDRSLPLCYDQTYYAALPLLYNKMKNTEGKKIVIIGNSSVAFGVDCELLEDELKKSGYDYTICNFGLYGAIGSVAMLELAKDQIKAGDILLYMPEANLQAQSLYFSATELWYSLEQNEDMVWKLSGEHLAQMLANYPSFISKRKEQNGSATPSGIYALSSFNEQLNLKNYNRKYNEMMDNYDENNAVRLDELRFSSEYYAYVNDYYKQIDKKGAEMYFTYSPVNKLSLSGDVKAYCSAIEEECRMPILGGFNDSVMDHDWFYDSNFHLNESGMKVFTVQLFERLKTVWGDTSKTQIELPEKPQKDQEQEVMKGDNQHEELFAYEEYNEGYRIVGLQVGAEEKKTLVLPVEHEGKQVIAISATALKQAKNLTELIVQSNIRSLPDSMFTECKDLKKVTVKHSAPDKISVGFHLLDGTSAKIYVPKTAKSAFQNNYFWGNYAGVIVGYEE